MVARFWLKNKILVDDTYEYEAQSYKETQQWWPGTGAISLGGGLQRNVKNGQKVLLFGSLWLVGCMWWGPFALEYTWMMQNTARHCLVAFVPNKRPQRNPLASQMAKTTPWHLQQLVKTTPGVAAAAIGSTDIALGVSL